MKKVSAAARRIERNPTKIARVVKEKGYSSGKLPAGKILHHVRPVATGGKTTTRNTRVVTKSAHKKIHANRRAADKI